MPAIVGHLVPVFLLIATGYAAHATRFVTEAHWAGLERVTYYFFFPATIALTLARADLSRVPAALLAGTLLCSLLAMMAVMLMMRTPLERLGVSGPAFTSVFQGSTRWNSFVGIALAASLLGAEGLTLIAVAVVVMIPLLNVAATLVLQRHGSRAGDAPGALRLLLALAANPFIWSSGLGACLNALVRAGMSLPKPLLAYGDSLGQAALASGLLVVGAGLDLGRLKRPGPALLLSCAAKLVVMPLLTVAFARVFGLTGHAYSIALVASAVPTAAASYILARQRGGDALLMAEILTLQTLLAALTMPLMLGWLDPQP